MPGLGWVSKNIAMGAQLSRRVSANPHFFFSLAIRFAAEEDRVKVVVATGSIESLRLVFALPYR